MNLYVILRLKKAMQAILCFNLNKFLQACQIIILIFVFKILYIMGDGYE